VGGDVPVDSEALLVTDFMNLKIKLVQFFGGAHRSRVCVRVFICVSVHTNISIYNCNMFLKKSLPDNLHSMLFTTGSERRHAQGG
jgi:hypothetical protein